MKDKSKEILSKLTLEEKIALLTGITSQSSAGIERLGIEPKSMLDGPHGVRSKY